MLFTVREAKNSTGVSWGTTLEETRGDVEEGSDSDSEDSSEVSSSDSVGWLLTVVEAGGIGPCESDQYDDGGCDGD